ncbi:MAG: MFS transporter [Acidobacteriota bacterium]
MKAHFENLSDPKPSSAQNLMPLAITIFFQMLPATLVAPAIRPLFAQYHASNEGAMHAFMGINMLGAAIAAPLMSMWFIKGGSPRKILAVLTLSDALLLLAVACPISTTVVLFLRFLEGATHVGAATILLAQASTVSHRHSGGRIMGIAGAAIISAVALGNAIGGLTTTIDPRVPFWLGSVILASIGVASMMSNKRFGASQHSFKTSPFSVLKKRRALIVPICAAFIERFTVGCIIVTFSLFAHRAYEMSDRNIGLLFALLTFTFALSMYPIGHWSDRLARSLILVTGGAIYAVALALLGHVSPALLPIVMIAAGAASSMIYAPTLAYASELAVPEERTQVMALVNSAGCLGMLLGPMMAGILSVVLRTAEDPLRGYRGVFLFAALSVIVWLIASARWLVERLRQEQPQLECPWKKITAQTKPLAEKTSIN